MSYVKTTELSGPEFILLTPGSHPARTGQSFGLILDPLDHNKLMSILESASKSQILALDFETNGGDVSLPSIEIVGTGLAWDTGSCYIPGVPPEDVLHLIYEHKGLIAHNVYFDGGVLLQKYKLQADFHACTYALLAMLHNESPESRWGLKNAQVKLLGWEDSNEKDLDEWLVTNGYYVGVRRVDSSPENLLEQFKLGKLKAEKGEMWRAPQDILGKYCILDAESCYLLFTEILRPVYKKFPGMVSFFHSDFMHLIKQLIQQRVVGMLVARHGLIAYKGDVEEDLHALTKQFLEDSRILPHTEAIQIEMRKEIYLKQPEKFKKDGDISKVWLKKQEKIRSIEAGEDPEYNFNIQSGEQLRELFYNKLNYPVEIWTSNEEKPQPAVSTKAMKKMGDLGNLIVDRADKAKALTFIDKYIDLTEHRDTLHPGFRTPGTITGRLSGKEPNLQQMPKTKSMMCNFHARPGKVWVDLDFSALEPVVLTEFSQDPNLALIYGDGRPSNDVYLFVGAHIPGMGDKIRAAGYDPYNPTKEGLAAAKKLCKHERSICKTVVLACQYGAGARKVHNTLEEQNIFMEYYEVEKIHRGYWEIFAQVKDFERSLYFEWKRNKGFIMNGLGRPMAVAEAYQKDMLNRFVQSTGHDILTMYIRRLCNLLESYSIGYTPIIIDFHDATTVEVAEEHGDRTVEVFNEAMDLLNKELNGNIKLKGVPVKGYDLAECKEPEE